MQPQRHCIPCCQLQSIEPWTSDQGLILIRLLNDDWTVYFSNGFVINNFKGTAMHRHMLFKRSLGAWAAGILGLCSIMSCRGENVKPGDRDYPQENPNPTKFLSIHGTIDTLLDLDFRIEWHSENAQCQYAISRIAGAYTWYTAWSPLIAARQGTQFTARVPIDGVLPGRCQWRFAGVTFGGHTGYRSGLIATNSYPLKPGQSPNGIAELHCKWVSINQPGFINPNLDCRWPKNEDPNASVSGGKLWWHPGASELELHIIAE
jgi:hypothetical protein